MKVEKTHLVSRKDGLLGIVGRFVPVFRMRPNLVSGKLVRKFLEHGLHFIQLEVHHDDAKRRSLKSD